MKIVFVLPDVTNSPIGGYKMVYEYANRLTLLGHEVGIVFWCANKAVRWWLPKCISHVYSQGCIKIFPSWFKLNKAVKKYCIFNINDKTMPDCDVVIATAVRTAPLVVALNKIKNKCYFIQGYENWSVSSEYVNNTYMLGLKNIVIADWLKIIVDKYASVPSVVVKNGIDFSVFDIDKDIDKRNPYTVAMLYHSAEYKGSKYGVEGLKRLKEKYPQLKAYLFGTVKRPEDLPNWIEYTYNATEKQLRNIYNNAAIFLYNTIVEGYGLTGAEAMACGCMYVSSDYLGVHEYTENGRNVILYEPKNIDSLVEKMDIAIRNDALRIKIATQGYKDIHTIDWNIQLKLFEEAITINGDMT